MDCRTVQTLPDAVIIGEQMAEPDALAADIAAAVIAACRLAVCRMPAVPGMTRATAGRMAHAYARECIAYIAETGDQYVRMPWRTMTDGRADCKSTAIFVAALTAPHGCRVDLVFCRWHGDRHLGHVYCEVDGIPADPLREYAQADPAAERIRVNIATGL